MFFSGNVIYDFFIGRELNPRVGMLDLKFLCALRPGLIALVVLIWILVIKAYEETGSYPPNLVLVAAFQTLYVADRLWCEVRCYIYHFIKVFLICNHSKNKDSIN